MNNSSCIIFGVEPRQENELITSNEDLLMVVAVFLAFVSAFTVISNTVVIVALVRPRHHEKTITTTLVTSMAVSDCILGVFIMPLGIYEVVNNGKWDFGPELCDARLIGDIVLCTVSIFHVTNMAIERYIAVCKPLVHRTLSIKTTYLMLCLSWCVPLSVVALPVLAKWHTIGIEDKTECLGENGDISMCVLLVNIPFELAMASMSFFAPIIIILIFYALIFNEARASSNFMSKLDNKSDSSNGFRLEASNGIKGSGENVSTFSTLEKFTERQKLPRLVVSSKKNKSKWKNVKTAKAIGQLVVCFTICWMPFSIWVIVGPFVGFSMPFSIQIAITWLGYMNSAINPILYCSNKSIKASIYSLLCPKIELERRRRRVVIDFSNSRNT